MYFDILARRTSLKHIYHLSSYKNLLKKIDLITRIVPTLV